MTDVDGYCLNRILLLEGTPITLFRSHYDGGSESVHLRHTFTVFTVLDTTWTNNATSYQHPPKLASGAQPAKRIYHLLKTAKYPRYLVGLAGFQGDPPTFGSLVDT